MDTINEIKRQELPEEQEIDLIELAQKLWKERKFLLKGCGIAVVVGLIVAFSIPKEYTTTVKLAPETQDATKKSSLGGLAAMAGINLNAAVGSDAISPDLYPDVVQSTPFLLDLFPVQVTDEDGELRGRKGGEGKEGKGEREEKGDSGMRGEGFGEVDELIYGEALRAKCQHFAVGRHAALGYEARQGVAECLATLSERCLDHGLEEFLIYTERFAFVAREPKHTTSHFWWRREYIWLDVEEIFAIIPCLKQHRQYAIHLGSRSGTYPFCHFFLQHTCNHRNLFPVIQYFEKYLR